MDIREIRREADRLRKIESKRTESPLNREISLNAQRIRMQTHRQALGADLKLAALNYVKECDYRYFILFLNFFRICKSKVIIEFDYKIIVNTKHPAVLIGNMDTLCLHCHALKFKKESPGMCCANGKVSLQPLKRRLRVSI